MLREFFLGFIKIHILYHASRGAVYGAWLTQELLRHGYKLSAGTLYPTLHDLEIEGLLRSVHKVVGGRVRRYYTATAKGKRRLRDAQEQVRELVEEIFEDPQALARRKAHKRVTAHG
jgi:DNA-binding PadR family transcriptional regulator